MSSSPNRRQTIANNNTNQQGQRNNNNQPRSNNNNNNNFGLNIALDQRQQENQHDGVISIPILSSNHNSSSDKATSKSAFDWDVYKNRKSALQHLKRNCTLVDTILESEDGSAYEFVHSQVISALGDNLNDFINRNGTYVQSYRAKAFETNDKNSNRQQSNQLANTGTSTDFGPKDANQIDFSSSPVVDGSSSSSSSVFTEAAAAAAVTKNVIPSLSATTTRNSVTLSKSIENNNAVVSSQRQQSYWSRWPGQVKLIRLPKVNKYTLGILVECAYTGYIRTDLPTGGIWQVLKVANHYEMNEVIKACCNFLIGWLDRSNCVLFYHIGMKHRHQLQRSAWHKIRANFKYILSENMSHLQNNRAASHEVNQMATKQIKQHHNYNHSSYNNNNNNHHHHHYHHNQPNHNHKGSSSTASSSLSSSGGGSSSSRNVGANVYDDYNLLLQLAASQQQLTYQQQSNNNNNSHGQASSSQQQQVGEEITIDQNNNNNNNKQRDNNNKNLSISLASIKYEHFEPLLVHDKLNIENEETIWYAIKLWCNENLSERAPKLASLLQSMRFPRFKSGTDFSAKVIWRDPLILKDKYAQHELAVLDRNHRDIISAQNSKQLRDGFSLPCASTPRQLRPRVPHSILLAIGGWQQGHPTRLIESYDLNCNLWFESKFRIMLPLAYHGIEYINGLIYICGGTDGSEILNELFIFDPVRGDCLQKRSMHESRCYVSTANLGNNLYAIGGHNGTQRMKSAERYDLIDNFWYSIHDMNVARSDASACVHESLIYIAGGLNDQVIESSVEFYNNQDDTWTFITSMITPRTSFTLLLFKNTLLAIGGNNGSERLSSVEQYNFSTKTWSQHSNMRHKRSTFSAALLDEDKLVVVGGYNGQTPFNQVEMFDEESSSWLIMQKIRYDRSGLKVIVVNDVPNASEYTFLGNSG